MGRSGHGVVVNPAGSKLLLVAGWPELHDLYSSADGVEWEEESETVWNCAANSLLNSCGRFDFWAVVHRGQLVTIAGSGATSTFGRMYSEVWSINASTWD